MHWHSHLLAALFKCIGSHLLGVCTLHNYTTNNISLGYAYFLSDGACLLLQAEYYYCFYCSIELSIQKIHHILAHIPPLQVLEEKPDYEMWIGSGKSARL